MAETALTDLWPAASMLMGLQVAALGWRINRELVMAHRRERT